MKEIYINEIASKAQCLPWQVENCVELLKDGSTIPFISRYRKERTGGLDEVAIATVKHWLEVFEEMDKRKDTVLQTIADAGALTDSLRLEIENCVDPNRLEDIYLPFRPKRRTRATAAREAGLQPLADKMLSVSVNDPLREASHYVNDKLTSADDALAGARDIIAEQFSETASVREMLRELFLSRRIVSKATKASSQNPEAQKYKQYFEHCEPLSQIPPHRLLAMLRARDEGFLNLKIDVDAQRCCKKIYYDFCQSVRYPSRSLGEQLLLAIEDSYKRLLEPSITTEVLKTAKEKADIESVKIFGDNLRQLLLAAPLGGKRVMAIDPGFRTGCKDVCLDGQGGLLCHDVIYPHPPSNDKVNSIRKVSTLADRYAIEAIAVGNGTAGRETEEFLRKVPLPQGVRVFSVSEDGASIYSASDIARDEFPQYDVTVRGAVSIGRRLMDPLAELVKIDPKSLGVGQYQHDVDQSLLKEQLDNTVESCVNSVGVNLNTASVYLLGYVSGIGPSLAANIVEYRTANGAYTSRTQLKKVKRLGEKAFEQCAGFLRIPGAENPLDASAVHPESYHIALKMAEDLGVGVSDLVGNAELCGRIDPSRYVGGPVGLPTVNDIISELRKPGRDPREEVSEFSFADDIHTLEDLKTGMSLPGIVTNITAFGAFVDIGIKTNGLIHASQLGVPCSRGQLPDPSRILKLHQRIMVEVISVDEERNRISLKLITK